MNEAPTRSAIFSEAALVVLDQMAFNPMARGRFEWLSGGLIWPDELPRIGTAEWDVVSPGDVYRFLIAYRASITVGPERAEFRPVWEQVVEHAPNWPGLRPERRDERAARRLRAAYRRRDRCLAELETRFEADKPNTG